MNRRVLRAVASIAVLAATITAFIYYFVQHPSVRHQIGRLSPGTLALLLVFYFGTVIALALVNEATVRLCKIKMAKGEGLLLTAYSSVINFFGPLQSGPAFRAVYLRQKHHIDLKNYAAATFLYYFFYGAFSGLFLLSGLLHWWLAALIALGVAVMFGLRQSRWLTPRLAALDLGALYLLAGAALLQVSLYAVIYFIELHSIVPGIRFSQAIVYAGAANLALFVSITPGAIGFRESFLVFSQHLHHVSNSAIVAANIIDRSVYIVLLLIMAVFIFASHARRSLTIK